MRSSLEPMGFLSVTLVESNVTDRMPMGSNDEVIEVQDGRGTFDFCTCRLYQKVKGIPFLFLINFKVILNYYKHKLLYLVSLR